MMTTSSVDNGTRWALEVSVQLAAVFHAPPLALFHEIEQVGPAGARVTNQVASPPPPAIASTATRPNRRNTPFMVNSAPLCTRRHLNLRASDAKRWKRLQIGRASCRERG